MTRPDSEDQTMIDGISALGGISSPSSSPGGQVAAGGSAEGVTFEQALGQVIGSAVDTLKTGEAAAIQGVEGAASPMRVVESVMDAQRSLQSVLAIRDKIVSAYQEVARMAI